MLINLVGLLLGFSITIHLWIIYSLYRQKISSLFIPLYIYLNILLLVIEGSAIFLLDQSLGGFESTIFKIRFIAQVFIPPLLFHMNQTYSLSKELPKFTPKNIVFFAISLALSALVITGVMIKGSYIQNGVSYPLYNSLYWLFLLYFYATFYYLLSDFVRKYRNEKRKPEAATLRTFINIIMPITFFLFSILDLLPFWGIIHPSFFLAYPVFTGIFLVVAFNFNLFGYQEYILNSFLYFIFSIFIIILISVLPLQLNTLIFWLIIPALIVGFFLFNELQNRAKRFIQKQNEEYDYDLEAELESFVGDIGKYIDDQLLAGYLGEISKKILRCSKCAVIYSKFDIRPYEIAYTDGFTTEEAEELVSVSNSPIIEKLELGHSILNKFEFPVDSSISQMMERYKIYLGIPLINQENLMGFVFLGGDRKSMRFLDKDLRFARFLSVQGANALRNIQAIQSAVQAQKMADLGLLASQLAHDFQSFITLVKLDAETDSRLRNHAAYMEKLVQDLLNYARPQDLRLASVNINQLIDMTLDLVNIPSDIVVEKHYSVSIPEINVDGNQMRRVFLNLFENSIRSMKNGGGRIKISTRPLRPISKVKRNPWIYIEILDEGIGIPEEFLEKVFEPFFTTRKHEGGNGMGLAMVKQTITRHKGFIDVTSKVGKGTVFNIRLPYLI